MVGTLPLFDELEPPAPGQRSGRPAASLRHLRAARRLSRSMRRYPERSPEQTRAGIAICRHLQAVLADSERSSG
ncbi:MAG: hypothetical protein ACODAC_02300 [Pseudomonadota bacterium]